MPRPPRIDVVRLWTQRHAHHDLHLAEDGQGRIWLRLRDLRHWMTGLPPDAEMLRRLPAQLALADASREPYIDTDALALLTRKVQNPATLKLLAWLEANVLHPSRRRSASAPPAPRAVLPPWWAAGIDPRWWFIAQGRWSPWRTAFTGLLIGLAGLLVSRMLALQTWVVEGSYGLWLWLAALTGLWCTVWCGAWVIGSVRCASRHAEAGDGRTAWTPLLLGLGGAPVLALAAVLGLGGLLQAGWSAVRGEGAASITPLTDADGQVRALRISGTLGMGSTQALRAALAAHPQVQRLEIHSPGGLVTEGHGMAQLALQRALNTEARVACEAACTLVFVAGDKRLLAREASLGFGGLMPSLAPVVADFYRQRGVPEDFVQQALGRRSWQPVATPASTAVAAGVAQAAP